MKRVLHIFKKRFHAMCSSGDMLRFFSSGFDLYFHQLDIQASELHASCQASTTAVPFMSSQLGK